MYSYNTLLYAGGWLTSSGSTPASHIASWNGTSWSALGTGTDNYVYAIADFNGDIYAGGTFLNAGSVTAHYVAHWVLPTAIQDAVQVNSSVSIYPNPFSEEATIVIYDIRFTNYDLLVYDISGKNVIHLRNQSGNSKIQRGNLKSGIYFYKILSKDSHSLTGKFIVD